MGDNEALTLPEKVRAMGGQIVALQEHRRDQQVIISSLLEKDAENFTRYRKQAEIVKDLALQETRLRRVMAGFEERLLQQQAAIDGLKDQLARQEKVIERMSGGWGHTDDGTEIPPANPDRIDATR